MRGVVVGEVKGNEGGVKERKYRKLNVMKRGKAG